LNGGNFVTDKKLKGWNFIVYTLIKSNFKNKEFSPQELYKFESYFRLVYPSKLHIKDKLRQTLQNLRNKGLLVFLSRGVYQMKHAHEIIKAVEESKQELVYLLSNESIPEWVKIGRTNAMDRRLKELYSTSVPLPFKVEECIQTSTLEESKLLEKSIHEIIDTLNPSLRKHTEAFKREFFKMTVEQGKYIFKLVNQIVKIAPITDNRVLA
jgi:hypothetical protein